MGRKGTGNGSNVVGKRAGANSGIGGGNVEGRGMHLPQGVPGRFFLFEVLGDGRARDVETGGPDVRI
jgi:hypothetical protein